MSPFDFLNAINLSKKDVMDPDNEHQYNSFVVNRTLSYFPDTVIMANEVNANHHIDNKLQFDFLINIVRKRKRFTKWLKAETQSDLDCVKQYYGYSNAKAQQAISLLSPADLLIIKQKVDKGGKR